jgi:hypothetical protein
MLEIVGASKYFFRTVSFHRMSGIVPFIVTGVVGFCAPIDCDVKLSVSVVAVSAETLAIPVIPSAVLESRSMMFPTVKSAALPTV